MILHLARRTAAAVALLFLISFATYALLDLAPGDAAEVLVGDTATQEQLSALRHSLGLDQPLPSRYFTFIKGVLLHGDLGESLMYDRPVSQLIASRFPYTLTLTLLSMLAATLLGTGAGWLAAAFPYGRLDALVMGVSTLGVAFPNYWLALLLMALFSVLLGWLPVVGAGSPAHFVLPVVCLALPMAAGLARMTRASLLDVKNQDYIRTAYGKGVGPARLWRVHIWRNASLPVLTMIGLHLGHLLGGAFIIETLFSWPGLGRLVTQAVFSRDYPVVVGAVIVFAVSYQMINLFVDFLQALLDPRIGESVV
jgi:ABC-type dipeptide/oligopeptide/nickel transport system permease component